MNKHSQAYPQPWQPLVLQRVRRELEAVSVKCLVLGLAWWSSQGAGNHRSIAEYITKLAEPLLLTTIQVCIELINQLVITNIQLRIHISRVYYRMFLFLKLLMAES